MLYHRRVLLFLVLIDVHQYARQAYKR